MENSQELSEYIYQQICDMVASSAGPYRKPLMGVADARHPGFAQLKQAVGPDHLMPDDLLPGARSVIAFFIPFSEELVEIHRRHPGVSREWAEAYVKTNHLIGDICLRLVVGLKEKGVNAAWQQATHNFDPEALISRWSHRHVAYLCGLGGFGFHHLLITSAGCAGRLGSLVVDCRLPETPVFRQQVCPRLQGRSCYTCLRRCPVQALTPEGLDARKCYRNLLKVSEEFKDLGLCDVCGKCATGPCATGMPD